MRNLLHISSFAAGYGVPNYAEIWNKEFQTFYSVYHKGQNGMMPSVYHTGRHRTETDELIFRPDCVGYGTLVKLEEGEPFEVTLVTACGKMDQYMAVVEDGELMVCPHPLWSGDGAVIENHVHPLEEEYGKGIRFHSCEGDSGSVSHTVDCEEAIKSVIWRRPAGSEEVTQEGWPTVLKDGEQICTVWDTIHKDGEEFTIITDSRSMLLESEVYTQDGRVFVLNIYENEKKIFPPKNRFWPFAGHGNYSDDFGGDAGISCNLGQETSFRKIVRPWQGIYSCSPIPGVKIFRSDTYGGSREVYGFVVAPSEEQAKQLLKLYEETYM